MKLRYKLYELKWAILKVWSYYKGRLYCLRMHEPVIRNLGGYGGSNHWGQRRKAYHGMWCVVCGTRWEQPDCNEPTTGSHMWHWRRCEKPKAQNNAQTQNDDLPPKA